MRTNRLGAFALALAVAGGATALAAAPGGGRPAQDAAPAATQDPKISLVEQAECLAFGDARTARHARTGNLRSITTVAGRAIPHPRPRDAQGSPEDAARSYLSVCGSLFGLEAPEAQLTLRDHGSQSIAADQRAPGNRSFVRFQQTHRGVPIVGGELNIHLDEKNNVLFAGGKTLSTIRLNIAPAVDAAAAVDAALDAVAKSHAVDRRQLTATSPSLWIFSPTLVGPSDGPARLVWRLEVTPRPLLPIRELVLIDARQGGVALHFNQVDTLLNRQTYSAGNGVTLPGTLVCSEAEPACTGGDIDAVSAHVYAGDTYSFYLNTLGRNGINNAGLTITSSVHYGPAGYQNAFWNGAQTAYGDGFSRGDDVVAHELTHGVTQYTSHLFYYYQSGAINESLSDVFGELIDQTNGRGNDSPGVRWLFGEDLAVGAARNMATPGAFGDPDRMTSPYYYRGDSDAGGVHWNSAVNSKAAFLMVDGGAFNGQTIAALGATKVAKIYYEVQTLLTSGSDYGDLYDALYQACNNLIGSAGIAAIDCQQVRNATIAVEMNLQPATGFNPDAALCAAGEVPSNRFFDNMEAGTANWTSGVLVGTNRWFVRSDYAHSGTISLYGADVPAATSDSYAAMATGVVVPANAFLHFAHAFDFDSDANGYWDGGVLEYSTSGGASWVDAAPLIDTNGYRGTLTVGTSDNPLRGRPAFVGASHGYISSRLNLQSLAGQTIRFRWRIGLDSFVAFGGWFVDDVRLYTCLAPTITADAVSPSAGAGATQIFSLQYSDSVGATDIATAWMWINATFASSSANSCLIRYTRATNTLALLNDAGGAYLTGSPGSAATLENSQCGIALAGSTAVAGGNTLTLTLAATFAPAFAGAKTVFMYADNATGAATGWQTRGTWNVPAGALPILVTAESVTPTAGSGPTQTFAIQSADTAGASDLATAWVWINAAFANSAGSCFFYYTRAANAVSLLNDAGSAYLTGILGSATTLQNGQCSIALANSSAVPSGNTLTLTVPLTFAPAFAGAKNVYLYAANATGASSGWQTRGTWTVPSGAAPVIVTADTVTPGSGNGSNQTFALQYSDTAGAADLATAWVWINTSFANPVSSCMFYYTRAANTLSLLNDAGTAYLVGTVGSTATVQNSQCGIALGGSTAVSSGNTLTLNLPMAFTPAFAGAKTVFIYAANATGATSGWQTRGIWTVPSAAAPVLVTADAVTPGSGSGASQTFALQYADTAGAADLSTAWGWINATFASSAASSCLFYYTRGANTVSLLNDAGSAYVTGTLGSAATLHNSQCAIALASSTAIPSGNALTVNLATTFAPAFAGAKNVYLYAASASGASSGWVTRGTWTVP